MSITGVSNPGCYLRETKNCGGPLTKEHYISQMVLDTMKTGGTVGIVGFPWQHHEKTDSVGTSSLSSKVLCKQHNHALSQLDEEAGQLIETVGSYDRAFNQKNPQPETAALHGSLLERWMLKATCGMLAAGILSHKGVTLEAVIPAAWVSILTNEAKWPEGRGLYIGIPTDVQYHSSSFSVQPVFHPKTGEILIVRMTVNGVVQSLLLGRVDNPATLGIYRPKKLVFEQRGVEKVIKFSWPATSSNQEIRFTRIGTYDGPPPTY